MATRTKKANKITLWLYRTFGRLFGTLLFCFILLCGLSLILMFLGWIYVILELFSDVLPILLSFILGFILSRLSR